MLDMCFAADEVGNERGYVVEMKDDTLAEPYELAPGQKVRLSSTYDALQDHYGELLSTPLPRRHCIPHSMEGQMSIHHKTHRTRWGRNHSQLHAWPFCVLCQFLLAGSLFLFSPFGS
jgi:hypothetical protein